MRGGDEGLWIDLIQQGVCFCDVRSLPGRQGQGDRLSRSIDNGVDFRSQSATGLSDGLIRAPFLRAPALCW
ncbi:hypothetical protein AAJCM20276_25020 [Acetobacter aceti]|uniref:Uncharacterized protein n=1 Tax=Acetobacter aceti TaxID=435 RepID=A0A6S6PJ66_ACEAC|nr:hypothetical protein AAJCM20276_25020 [Acetobacter aceti]